ncbi:hypothetical protein QR680_010033 [Steinernema hermaphroditum]|uniref:Secreted protein n=1 Tax=Steinernema hermaphroditum TaxID=289476 RepID=A0AA39INQ3_9BILA|nr:hypothetical protein QR680_010033 [Steinernema hermaphroditum]
MMFFLVVFVLPLLFDLSQARRRWNSEPDDLSWRYSAKTFGRFVPIVSTSEALGPQSGGPVDNEFGNTIPRYSSWWSIAAKNKKMF